MTLWAYHQAQWQADVRGCSDLDWKKFAPLEKHHVFSALQPDPHILQIRMVLDKTAQKRP